MLAFFIGFFIFCIVLAIIMQDAEKSKLAKMTPSARSKYLAKQKADAATFEHGPLNAAMICPHCQEKGNVRTKSETKKAGVSGGKATGAILTGGVSLLATGLSRKENVTKAFCGKCKSTWFF